MTNLVSTTDAIYAWEESVGDSGNPPTDEELVTYANAIAQIVLEAAATDLDRLQQQDHYSNRDPALWLYDRAEGTK